MLACSISRPRVTNSLLSEDALHGGVEDYPFLLDDRGARQRASGMRTPGSVLDKWYSSVELIDR